MDAIRRQLDGIYQEIQDLKIERKAPSTSAEMRMALIGVIGRLYDLAIILEYRMNALFPGGMMNFSCHRSMEDSVTDGNEAGAVFQFL